MINPQPSLDELIAVQVDLTMSLCEELEQSPQCVHHAVMANVCSPDPNPMSQMYYDLHRTIEERALLN